MKFQSLTTVAETVMPVRDVSFSLVVRDPQGGSIITSGDGFDWRGGPIGAILGVIGFVVVTAFLIGIAAIVSAILPQWLVIPAVLVSVFGIGVAGLWIVPKIVAWWERH